MLLPASISTNWSPVSVLLLITATISGAGDGIVNLWKLPINFSTSKEKLRPISLNFQKQIESNTNDNYSNEVTVTCLDFTEDSNKLACGLYNGLVIIFNKNGTLEFTLNGHNTLSPITGVKFNNVNLNLLCSVSIDRNAIIWDVSNGNIKHKISFHEGAILSLCWKDARHLTTCSTDTNIILTNLDSTSSPTKVFRGHAKDVNSIRWNYNKTLLASGSDDNTVKIWNLNSDAPFCDLKGHSHFVTVVLFVTVANESGPTLVASASIDCTVKIWDLSLSQCIWTLSDVCRFHNIAHPISTMDYNFSNRLLAVASNDRVLIWQPKDGLLIKIITVPAGVTCLCWNKVGNKLGIGSSDHTLTIVSLDK